MEREDTSRQYMTREAADRRGSEGPNLERLIDGIASSVEGLQRKNRQLEARNGELVRALEQCNERLVRFEQAATTVSELTAIALQTAAQMLDRAEEAIHSQRQAAEAEIAGVYADATARILQVQREVVASLEAARHNAERRGEASEQQAIDIVRETRQSIRSMAENLGDFVSGAPHQTAAWSEIAGVGGHRPMVRVAAGGTSAKVVDYLLGAPADQTRRCDAHAGAETALPIESQAHVGLGLEGVRGSHLLDGLRHLTDNLTHVAAIATPVGTEARNGFPWRERASGASHHLAGEIRMPAVSSLARSAELGGSRDSTELIASPFGSFATLSAFHRAVQRLPGVVDVRIKGFDKGRLRLAVKATGPTPLAGQLTELSQFELQYVSIEENSIEVVLERGNQVEEQPAGS